MLTLPSLFLPKKKRLVGTPKKTKNKKQNKKQQQQQKKPEVFLEILFKSVNQRAQNRARPICHADCQLLRIEKLVSRRSGQPGSRESSAECAHGAHPPTYLIQGPGAELWSFWFHPVVTSGCRAEPGASDTWTDSS